jgi:hypothetical protein
VASKVLLDAVVLVIAVAVAVATIDAVPIEPHTCASGYEIRGECVPVGVRTNTHHGSEPPALTGHCTGHSSHDLGVDVHTARVIG